MLFVFNDYCISCSMVRNVSVSKKSIIEISSPSHIFFKVTTPGFWLAPLMIFFSVDGGKADRRASPFIVNRFSSHSSNILFYYIFSCIHNLLQIKSIFIVTGSCFEIDYIWTFWTIYSKIVYI